ncbi:MAG: hypothetical protein WC784_01125 [Candidatus Shapirobacteria bacterium]|jgi:hypothetical protein
MIKQSELLSNQEKLQREAKEVIEKLNLVKILSQYGKVNVVGSLKYGLMVWRDIDIDLVLENEILEINYWEIVEKLFSNKKIQSMILSDNRNVEDKNRPKSLYIGIKYLDNKENIWKIDIRLLNKNDLKTGKIENLINDKITPENRLTILEIKSQVCNNPKYHKEFSSVDIYEEMLISGVKNLEEFISFLKLKSINMVK